MRATQRRETTPAFGERRAQLARDTAIARSAASLAKGIAVTRGGACTPSAKRARIRRAADGRRVLESPCRAERGQPETNQSALARLRNCNGFRRQDLCRTTAWGPLERERSGEPGPARTPVRDSHTARSIRLACFERLCRRRPENRSSARSLPMRRHGRASRRTTPTRCEFQLSRPGRERPPRQLPTGRVNGCAAGT